MASVGCAKIAAPIKIRNSEKNMQIKIIVIIGYVLFQKFVQVVRKACPEQALTKHRVQKTGQWRDVRPASEIGVC